MLKRTISAMLMFSCLTAVAQDKASRVRTFAALPDWTGIWQSAAWPLGVSGRPAGGEAQLRALLQLIRPPPYNQEWSEKYATGMKNTEAIAQQNANFKACTRSFPAVMEGPWLFQVLTLPEETLILFENGQVRHVYTDGRGHPSGDDLWPTRLGDSVGRWEGDTLRIDTLARSASEPLAPRAWVSMLSESAHFTERLRLVGKNKLEDDLTIEDPVTLAAPWHLTLKFNRVTELNRMIEYNCTENDRNPIVDGKLTVTAP